MKSKLTKKICRTLKTTQLTCRRIYETRSFTLNGALTNSVQEKAKIPIKFTSYTIKYNLQDLLSIRIPFFNRIFSNGATRLKFTNLSQNFDSFKDVNKNNIEDTELYSYYKKIEKNMLNIEEDIKLHEFIEKSIFIPFKKHLSESKVNEKIPTSLFFKSYPLLLQKAMEIFRLEFQDYVSVVTIFERIKDHGPESFVLGCSSDVYNEVLIARWEGWYDMFEIENLLKEMKMNCVIRTKKTLKILEKILQDIQSMYFQEKLANDIFLSDNNGTYLERLNSIYNEILQEISRGNK
ncbi:hypothetical protein PORY_001825 [Pneumocystis oryctolagi]|uniref:Uncharacterized protein n=1 Tax=Pneumocystis oryctolagi TaxID=42067 RepID=A0ACB7CAM0_9ASCO|nr:hypothetical protein PORY_001825 [Pneumocystis oryctolagi]